MQGRTADVERAAVDDGPAGAGTPTARTVRWVIGAAIVSTIVHYTDNFVHIDDYPQPGWINHAVIPTAWLALTAIGLAGYAFFRRGRYGIAGACLVVYSYTGLSSLAHYSFGPLSEFSPAMHAGILLDGATGAAVLAVAVWTLVAAARRKRAVP